MNFRRGVLLLLLERVSKGEYQELPSAAKPIMLPPPPWEIGLAKERELYEYMPVLTLAKQLPGSKQQSGKKDKV